MAQLDLESSVVVKLGGSLYDIPGLGPKLQRWLDLQFRDRRILVVPGGGPVALAVRAFDRQQRLGEETAHWLALQALRLNARMLARVLPHGQVVESLSECRQSWQEAKVPVLDAYQFARADEGKPESLPHSWDVTSDSIALRVAAAARASRLVLLKSTGVPPGLSWSEASRLGFVDRHFPKLLEKAAIEVTVVNFRAS